MMKIIAYLYSDPLLEATPDRNLWCWEVDRVYQALAIATVLKKWKETAIACLQWQQRLEHGQAAIDLPTELKKLAQTGCRNPPFNSLSC